MIDYYSPENYVIDANGCWRWVGKIMHKGYGYFRSFDQRAHRMYYEKLVGKIPAGAQCLHTCDVKACVNPDHLYIGSHTDNMRDASKRGQLFSPARLEAGLKNGASGRAKSLATRRANAEARKLSAN